MKRFIYVSLVIILFSGCSSSAQDKIYDPEINASEVISEAIVSAKENNKHVYVMIGFNACPWCLRLHKFIHNDQQIDSLLQANYELIYVNYSKENKNPEVMEQFGFPQRFGFPVIVILDQEGNRIHTQNTAYLEQEKSYDRKKLLGFIKDWSPVAVDKSTYTK